MTSYIPKRGDFVRMDFSPQAGHEQKGWRPALVVSPYAYNQVSNTCLVCAITRNKAPWEWKVLLPDTEEIEGAVLVDQVSSYDRRARGMKFIGRASPDVIARVLSTLSTLTARVGGK